MQTVQNKVSPVALNLIVSLIYVVDCARINLRGKTVTERPVCVGAKVKCIRKL